MVRELALTGGGVLPNEAFRAGFFGCYSDDNGGPGAALSRWRPVTAPARVSTQHQKLLHFVANATWSDEQMLTKVRELVVPSMTQRSPIEAWIIDDTSFPKKGRHSVGVHHQYCGQLGKQANCQVAVTLSIANHHASLPIAYRLYLPRDWINDRLRRAKAHVPRAIRFKTKPQIARSRRALLTHRNGSFGS